NDFNGDTRRAADLLLLTFYLSLMLNIYRSDVWNEPQRESGHIARHPRSARAEDARHAGAAARLRHRAADSAGVGIDAVAQPGDALSGVAAARAARLGAIAH